MTIVGWLQIALVLALVVGAVYPLGSFIAELFEGRRTLSARCANVRLRNRVAKA